MQELGRDQGTPHRRRASKTSRIRCGFERTKEVPSRVHQHDRDPADRHGGQHGDNSLDLDGIRGPVNGLRGQPVGNDHCGVLESKPIQTARTSRDTLPSGKHRRVLNGRRNQTRESQ
jgi:hypothetical protein